MTRTFEKIIMIVVTLVHSQLVICGRRSSSFLYLSLFFFLVKNTSFQCSVAQVVTNGLGVPTGDPSSVLRQSDGTWAGHPIS